MKCVICGLEAHKGTYRGIACCWNCYMSEKASVIDDAPVWILYAGLWLYEHKSFDTVLLVMDTMCTFGMTEIATSHMSLEDYVTSTANHYGFNVRIDGNLVYMTRML